MRKTVVLPLLLLALVLAVVAPTMSASAAPAPPAAAPAPASSAAPTPPNLLGGPYPHALLAAQWWQWALGTPAATNPVVDKTGANCGVNQRGPVFFLAGTFTGGNVSRTCSVPANKALFFPIANMSYGAFLNDPPETRTIAFAREQVACAAGSITSATVDGVKLKSSAIVAEKSVVFAVQLPVDNVLGLTSATVPGLLLSPVVDQGSYVLLAPLKKGTHTITFTSAPGTSTCTLSQTVSYTLNVA